MDSSRTVKVSASSSSTSTMPGELHPTNPKDNARYNRHLNPSKLSYNYMTVSPPRSRNVVDLKLPRYLPQDWAPFIHPEGQPYFARQTASHVVTDSNLYDSSVRMRVEYWTKYIESEMIRIDLNLTEDLELYLNVDVEKFCFYYFIDHKSRSLFWLEPIDITEAFGMAAAVSQGHLDIALQELYWNHVEYYPVHFGGLPVDCIEELISVYSHGFIDQATSDGSTFPYTKQDCEKFVQMLSGARHSTTGHQTWIVARLQGPVCLTRFQTHYGEPHARLTRDEICPQILAQVRPWVSTVVSSFSFGMAQRYSHQLDTLYINEIVYGHQWQPFISACLDEWKDTFMLTTLSSLLHLLFFFAPGSQIMTMVSILFFMGSAAASSMLIHYHRPLNKKSSPLANYYLRSVYSESNHFLLVALTYAVPSVLHILGLFVLVINCIFSIFLHFGFIPAALSSCFVFLSAVFVGVIYQGIRLPSVSFRSHHNKTTEDIV